MPSHRTLLGFNAETAAQKYLAVTWKVEKEIVFASCTSDKLRHHNLTPTRHQCGKWPCNWTRILVCKFQAAMTNPDEQNTTVEHSRVSTSKAEPHLDAPLFLTSNRDLEWKVNIISLQSSFLCNILLVLAGSQAISRM